MEQVATIADLPPEVLTVVLGYVDTDSQFAAKSACRLWKAVFSIHLGVRKTKTTVSSVGHTESLLEWALSNGCPWSSKVRDFICKGGFLNLMKMTMASGLEWYAGSNIPLAAQHGRLEMLKWAKDNIPNWYYGVLVSAAKGGHLDILKWAKENNIQGGSFFVYTAAANGHVHILEWAYLETNYYPDVSQRSVSAFAALSGNLATLKWTHKRGFAYDEKVCSYAAREGKLEILKWARANGYPWDEYTMIEAAENGHMKVLEWAYENGCRQNGYACNAAWSAGHSEICKWLHATGQCTCPMQ